MSVAQTLRCKRAKAILTLRRGWTNGIKARVLVFLRENDAPTTNQQTKTIAVNERRRVASAPVSYSTDFCISNCYWRNAVSASNQWVITVVAEGADNPFDIVASFLEDLRVRGDYTIVSFVTTPTSGIASGSSAANDNHDGPAVIAPHDHDADYIPTFAEIIGCPPDGSDYATTYAGISVARTTR